MDIHSEDRKDEMNITVGKWGNSLGVRIPGALAKELGLQDGSQLDLQNVSGTLTLRPVAPKEIEYSLEELLSQITPESLHRETDWGSTAGREEW